MLAVVVCKGACRRSVCGCLSFYCARVLVLLLCAGALRRTARGRVIIMYTGACSLDVLGYLGSPLRCTGGRCSGYSVWPFHSNYFWLIAYGACHSVGPHSSNH